MALQFDNAVALVGTVIEGASQETDWVGSEKNRKMVPRYHMDQLLDPDFKLPRPKTAKERERESVAALFALARSPKSGVKVFKARSPEGEDG